MTDPKHASATTTVHLNANLVRAARTSAKLNKRSTADQVERWVRLGQMAESVLSESAIKAIQATGSAINVLDILSAGNPGATVSCEHPLRPKSAPPPAG